MENLNNLKIFESKLAKGHKTGLPILAKVTYDWSMGQSIWVLTAAIKFNIRQDVLKS